MKIIHQKIKIETFNIGGMLETYPGYIGPVLFSCTLYNIYENLIIK